MCVYTDLHHVVADAGWCGLHEDLQRVAEDGDGGGQHQDGEDEGADRVDDRPLRLEVDHQGSREHA